MQKPTIRRMAGADVDAVAEIYAGVLHPGYVSFSELNEGKAGDAGLSPEAPAIFRRQVAELVQSAEHGFFVAEAADKVIGFALASLRRAEAGHAECWLDDLGVAPEWRGRGVAKDLVARVLEWGGEGNASYYLLESGVKNESAHHLFEALGFKPLSTVFWRGPGGGRGEAARGGGMHNKAIAWLNVALEEGHVADVEEVRAISDLDAEFYGRESIDYEGLCEWWKTFPRGIHVLRREGRIVGAIGVWPLKEASYERLVRGEIDETDIGAHDLDDGAHGRPLPYWYFADIVLERGFHQTSLALALMEETLSRWAEEGNLAPEIHVCALGFEEAGRKLLRRFTFLWAGGIKSPTGKPVYTRSMTTQELREVVKVLKTTRDRRAGGKDHFDVFISYRRQPEPELFARLLQCKLEGGDLNVFLDVDDLRAGSYEKSLRAYVDNTPNFILILSPGCLDGLDEHDCFRREITRAIRGGKKIIPIQMPGFEFPQLDTLPKGIKALRGHETIFHSHKHFDEVFKQLVEFIRGPNPR